MKQQINILQAYKAMCCFLEKYYQNTSSDDVGSLLGDLQFLKSGKTADPAVWQEWIDCINKVIKTDKEYQI